jgi:hypothetical protein
MWHELRKRPAVTLSFRWYHIVLKPGTRCRFGSVAEVPPLSPWTNAEAGR